MHHLNSSCRTLASCLCESERHNLRKQTATPGRQSIAKKHRLRTSQGARIVTGKSERRWSPLLGPFQFLEASFVAADGHKSSMRRDAIERLQWLTPVGACPPLVRWSPSPAVSTAAPGARPSSGPTPGGRRRAPHDARRGYASSRLDR